LTAVHGESPASGRCGIVGRDEELDFDVYSFSVCDLSDEVSGSMGGGAERPEL
jgi:hypothetical protein